MLSESKENMSHATKNLVTTSFGKMAYWDYGAGFPLVMIHGLGQSSYFWRNQIEAFSSGRRCIAVDLMAHGRTEANPGQDVSFSEQAQMILEALARLGVERFDLLLNDSGGAVGQIMACKAPERVRSMVLTNCDVHDNWPPQALGEIRDAARAGLLADQFGLMIETPELFFAEGGIGPMVYEDAEVMTTPESIEANIRPLVSSAERKAAFNRYAGLQDDQQLVVVEAELRKLPIPSLIVWGTADVFFPVEWAYWLRDALPQARDVIEVAGAKLFFPEERPDELNEAASAFWNSLS